VTLWVVMGYFEWSDLRSGSLRVEVDERVAGDGFAPVFKSLADALLAYPNCQIRQMTIPEEDAQ
jgi:hypothetical protein